MAVSDETKEHLEIAKKGKPRKFVLLVKGASIVNLVLFKRGDPSKFVTQAKKEGTGTPYFGVITGKGMDLNFQLAINDGFDKKPIKDLILKQYLSDEADFKCKPLIEIVQKHGPQLDPEDPLHSRFLRLQEAVIAACDKFPEKAEELNDRILAIGKLFDAEQPEPATMQLGELTKLLESLSSEGDGVPPEKTAYETLRAKLATPLKAAKLSVPEKAAAFDKVWDYADKQAQAGKFYSAQHALAGLAEALKKLRTNGVENGDSNQSPGSQSNTTNKEAPEKKTTDPGTSETTDPSTPTKVLSKEEEEAKQFLDDFYNDVTFGGRAGDFAGLETADVNPPLKSSAVEIGKIHRQLRQKIDEESYLEARDLFDSLNMGPVLAKGIQLADAESDKVDSITRKLTLQESLMLENPFLQTAVIEYRKKWKLGGDAHAKLDINPAFKFFQEAQDIFDKEFAAGSEKYLAQVMKDEVGPLDDHPGKAAIAVELAELHTKAELAGRQYKDGLSRAADGFIIEIQHSVPRLRRIADEFVAYEKALLAVKKIMEDLKLRPRPETADEVKQLTTRFEQAVRFGEIKSGRYVEALHGIEYITQAYAGLKEILDGLDRAESEKKELLNQPLGDAVKTLRERIELLEKLPPEVRKVVEKELELANSKLREAGDLLTKSTEDK